MTEVLSVSREGESQSAEGLLLKFLSFQRVAVSMWGSSQRLSVPETRPAWSLGFLSQFRWALVPLSQAGTPLGEPASPLPATDPDQAPHGPSLAERASLQHPSEPAVLAGQTKAAAVFHPVG